MGGLSGMWITKMALISIAFTLCWSTEMATTNLYIKMTIPRIIECPVARVTRYMGHVLEETCHCRVKIREIETFL